jgi:hypothetical protein
MSSCTKVTCVGAMPYNPRRRTTWFLGPMAYASGAVRFVAMRSGRPSGVDFSRLSRTSAADTATEPRRVFTALPHKAAKYGYPRDVQTDVWERWHARRTERDLVLKMNTGAGKTVVGLILLKSCLNEGAGPAVYVSPDIYLADQVRKEAAALGIQTTDDPKSSRFLSGKAILVINVYKLVNGLSVFGVEGSRRQPIDIGAVVIDDAHACLATVQQQFTLNIPRSHAAYEQLFELFQEDLKGQSASGLGDLEEGVPSAVLPVPFWAWADRRDTVLSILRPHRRGEGFLFVWPLIAEVLPICRAAVASDAFEIVPPCPPIDRIPSFARARRRVYLTATLADDSVLVTHFAADPASVSRPITPATADDLGDRMILTPLETHPAATDEEVRAFLAEKATRHNVVVIVPSGRQARLWEPVADAEPAPFQGCDQASAALLVLLVDVLDPGPTGRHRGEQRRLPLDLVEQRVEIGQVGLRLAAEGVRVHGVHSQRPGPVPLANDSPCAPSAARIAGVRRS